MSTVSVTVLSRLGCQVLCGALSSCADAAGAGGSAKGSRAANSSARTETARILFMLNRISGLFFDLMVTASIAAISLEAFKHREFLLPLALICVAGALVTYWYDLKVCRFLFPDYSDESFLTMIFLKTLAAEYLRIKYGTVVPPTDGVLDLTQRPRDGELEDSFQRCSGKHPMTPSRLQAYLESPEFRAAMRGRKGLLCGGEAFSGDLLRALKNITDAHLYNQYGPSEATVGVSLARLDHCGEISVGSPMETDQYAILASRVGAVFHCAADVRHYASDGGSLDTNVAGTVNAADFALAVGVPFNHVSTLSVSGEYLLRDPEQTAVFTEADFDIGQNWQDNIYVRGKFLAEREVYDRVERGLCGRVFRLGRLVGRDSDGVFQPNPRSNAVYLTFRGVQAVGAIPRSMSINRFLGKIGLSFRKKDLLSIKEKAGFGNFDQFVVGGAHISRELSNDLKLLGITVLQGYGITECSPLISVNSMAAIGLNTDIVKLIKSGGKPILLGLCCWISIAGVSLLAQHLMGLL